MLCGVGVIALCSFFPFIIDPTRWQNTEFLSDELIMAAIVIFSTVCLMLISQASNAQNPNSNLAKARVKFFKSVARIIDGKLISSFSQWVKQRLQKNDIKSMKERMTLKTGVEDVSILELEDSEITALIQTPQKYGERYYKGITKKQANEIKKIKRMRIALVDPSYYLTCSSIEAKRTITEKSGGEGKKKAALLTWSITSKIVMSVIIAMIFASLIYDTTQGSNTPQAWMKFASRMFSMATSSFMGYMIGCQVNDIDADYIEMRCLAHDQFFEDRTFKAKTQQEDARDQFIERVKQENLLPYNTNGGDSDGRATKENV